MSRSPFPPLTLNLIATPRTKEISKRLHVPPLLGGIKDRRARRTTFRFFFRKLIFTCLPLNYFIVTSVAISHTHA